MGLSKRTIGYILLVVGGLGCGVSGLAVFGAIISFEEHSGDAMIAFGCVFGFFLMVLSWGNILRKHRAKN